MKHNCKHFLNIWLKYPVTNISSILQDPLFAKDKIHRTKYNINIMEMRNWLLSASCHPSVNTSEQKVPHKSLDLKFAY